jgi:Domain of Unknown Function (DUF1080)
LADIKELSHCGNNQWSLEIQFNASCKLKGIRPMKRLLGSLMLVGLSIGAHPVLSAEIKGKVAEVKDHTVKITSDSDLVPKVGDKVEIVFVIPGIDDVAHVAEAKVTEIGDDFILAKIESRKGKVAKNQTARIFSESPQKRLSWKSLFNGNDLTGWQEVGGTPNEWEVQDGLLHCKGTGGGWLGTTDEYANFEIALEFRLAAAGNSGVFLRSPLDSNAPTYDGMEIQLLDDGAPKYANLRPEYYAASIYDVVAAKPRVTKPAGEWQAIDILCDRRHVKVTLNGTVVLDVNLDDYKNRVEKHDDLLAHPGLIRTAGHIGLQNHTGPLDFRNLRIRVLP